MSSEIKPPVSSDHEDEKAVAPITISTRYPLAGPGVTTENYPTGQAYPVHYPGATVSYIVPSKDTDEGVIQQKPGDAALLDKARLQARNHAKVGFAFLFCNVLTLSCSIPAIVYAYRKNSTLADYKIAKKLGIASIVLAVLGMILWVALLAIILTSHPRRNIDDIPDIINGSIAEYQIAALSSCDICGNTKHKCKGKSINRQHCIEIMNVYGCSFECCKCVHMV